MRIKKPLKPEYKKEVLRGCKKSLDLHYELTYFAKACKELEKHLNGEESNFIFKQRIIVVSDPDGTKCSLCNDPIFSEMYTEMEMHEETGELDFDSEKRKFCESCVKDSIYDGLPKVYF